MGNPNTMMRPLHKGNQMVERISSYNLLALIINENWKWNWHVDYITAKASKKLYALRLLKRAGVQEQQEQVFRSSVRQILEYAVQVCGKTFLTICQIDRGSQWGGGIYGYRLKFWLFYGYRLIFFSYS